MMRVDKPLDLLALQAEIATNGITLPGALGLTGGDLHTYDADGRVTDLPPTCGPVVAAHDANTTLDAQGERVEDAWITQAADTIDGILTSWATLTAAQKDAVIHAQARLVRVLLRRYGLASLPPPPPTLGEPLRPLQALKQKQRGG
jgi:hypothetical protein